MNLKSLLKRYTVEQLKEALRLRSTYGRTQALEVRKSALLKQVAKIDRQLAKLDAGNGSTEAPKPGKQGRRKGYKLSAATRNRMRIAALKRYGKKTESTEPAKPERKTRKLSAAGRAAISAAAKARWERMRQAKAEPKAEATS